MKMQEALKIIETPLPLQSEGYMVSFEKIDGRILKSDYFPDKYAGEVLIASQGKAWELAEAFAAKTKGICVNIYVVDSQHRPVIGYKDRMIKNR